MFFNSQTDDPCEQLLLTTTQMNDELSQSNENRLEPYAEVKKLVITPTRAYFLPSGLDLSNKVFRKFGAEWFVRVTFTEEGMSILNKNMLNFYTAPARAEGRRYQHTSVYQRMEDILPHGFTLGKDTLTFLAYFSSQLRDKSAWFVLEKFVSNIRVDGRFQ